MGSATHSIDQLLIVHEFAKIDSIFLVPLSNKLHRSHSLVRSVSGVVFLVFSPVTDTHTHTHTHPAALGVQVRAGH